MAEVLAFPINRWIDAGGFVMGGAKAYFYDSETLNLRTVYTDSDLTVPHTNPVVADSGGLFPNIFLDPARSYRLILKDALGVTIADTDPITGSEAFDPGFPGDVNRDVEGKLRETVSVGDFGAIGDGTADDTTAIQAGITALAAGGTLKGVPGKTYSFTTLSVTTDDLTLDFEGSTITSAVASPTIAGISVSGASFVFKGKYTLTGGGETCPAFFDISGADWDLTAAHLVKTPDAGGYIAYFRHTADGGGWGRIRVEGSNGFYVECSKVKCFNTTAIGRASGGDDLFALKALNDDVSNITILGGYIENMSSGLSAGSEIGRAFGVGTARSLKAVEFGGFTMKNCYGVAFIKPGGIGSIDVRDGLVDGVNVHDIEFLDESGTKAERIIAITPARGATVRGVKTSNIRARSRTTAANGGRLVGVDVRNLDYRTTIHFTSGGTAALAVGNAIVGATSGATGTVVAQAGGAAYVLTSGSWAGGDAAGYFTVSGKTGTFVAENINVTAGQANIATVYGDAAAPSIVNCEIEAVIYDPWNGVALGAGGAPGTPFTHIVSVGNETPTHGTMSGVVLDIIGNGSAQAGFLVDQSLNSAVRIKRMQLTAVNVTNAAGQGGAYLLSDVVLGFGYWSVIPAAGTEMAGAGSLISQITSKDSGLTASGSLEVLPSIPSAHLDVDSGKGRVLAYQTGVGYLDLAFEAANILWRPAGALVGTVDTAGINLASGKLYKINAVQVVGARKTGWATATGTADRTTFDQATVTLPELAKRVKALIDDLHGTAGHGLIGT